MANMSFMLTTDQVRARTKTVTRRTGWQRLQVGDVLQAVVKCMGLRKGERVEPLARIRVVSVRREPLSAIDQADVAREGFPEMTPAQFVTMFCEHMRCKPDAVVTRIEFEYLPDPPPAPRLF